MTMVEDSVVVPEVVIHELVILVLVQNAAIDDRAIDHADVYGIAVVDDDADAVAECCADPTDYADALDYQLLD